MSHLANAQQMLWLANIQASGMSAEAVGGKASGLSQLMTWGLNVPNGFVIINAQKGSYPEALADFYQQLGAGKVAVRSSALGEDGNSSSFAGQYESILNVQGIDALKTAIDACVLSLQSQRASAYQEQQNINSVQMNVVIQNMVDASSAGVMFTVDPVSGRYDRSVIDAVLGLGESLVSGEATPDHYELNAQGKLVYSDLVSDTAILSEPQYTQLYHEAQQAVKHAGEPLDLEWAIDTNGELFWLQARPITTIGSDLNELDTPIKLNDVLTRCNVGEMMPGAVCPLTFSTTGRGIENGMQHMHVSYAGRPAINNEWTQVAMSHGKLFLNLTGAVAAASTVLGVDAKALGQSVCGRIVKELTTPQQKAIWIRLAGACKMLRYILSADDVITKFSARAKQFSLPVEGTSKKIVQALHDAQGFYTEAMAVHLQSSTTSGVASNILQAMISGGQESTPEQESVAANLMAGATEVESAVLVDQLDSIVSKISQHKNALNCFIDATPKDAFNWLIDDANTISKAFYAFLKRHGHRGYRELCMRENSWVDSPEQLITIMQASVKAQLTGIKINTKPIPVDPQTLSRGLRWILPKAHNAIRRREATKSLLVDITHRFKCSYRALANQLVSEGLLDDIDQVFFFTQDELFHYVIADSANTDAIKHWKRKLSKRRVALEFQNRLDFDEICVGIPQPIDERLLVAASNTGIVGRPVSLGAAENKGIIEAKARVAFSVADAATLKVGEILVAPITDVGWTPYFSMIAGLITDVGSAVSHGAVIAREYGLPAIVNTRIATQQIKTGDTIRLDANTGMVTILQKTE